MDGKNNNGAHNKPHGVSKKSDYYKFFLIKPKVNANANEVARELIAFSEVAEVYVTEGQAGFMVKAKFFDDNSPSDIEQYIKDKLGAKYGMLISPMQYAKVSR
ncbi:MAG: Lrp/AsnC ligand binding domain-containing protein [Candidatus Marsarchaeota archaeon]|jgi:hypothetical protein|nr:Lrp/AsnC ligand binding domain-containing protein [Candidatus Marsarchaeota archaeon]MCL5418910.1 Lrp/AsnC ligand binding domain-containing protein [Candidatus Marsarchaeota archaeon]